MCRHCSTGYKGVLDAYVFGLAGAVGWRTGNWLNSAIVLGTYGLAQHFIVDATQQQQREPTAMQTYTAVQQPQAPEECVANRFRLYPIEHGNRRALLQAMQAAEMETRSQHMRMAAPIPAVRRIIPSLQMEQDWERRAVFG
jgi:hypothetical protein